LKKLKANAEVLLVSFNDLKNVLEQKIGFKCDDCYMEDSAMNYIQNKIRDFQDKKKPFYEYVIVDLDDVSIIVERLGRSIKRTLLDNKIDPKSLKLYAFSSTASEKIEMHCLRGGFRFFIKPADKSGYLEVLRHMAEEK
jgi:hypothetical protein